MPKPLRPFRAHIGARMAQDGRTAPVLTHKHSSGCIRVSENEPCRKLGEYLGTRSAPVLYRGNRTGSMGKPKALRGLIEKSEGLMGMAGWSPLEDRLRPRLRPTLIGRAANNRTGAMLCSARND
jgi:predicted Rossmann-fold nucleotide-binding protein